MSSRWDGYRSYVPACVAVAVVHLPALLACSLGSECTLDDAIKLIADDAAAYDEFGDSVSIAGEVAIIGACEDDDLGSRSGSAYAFRHDGTNWHQVAKLLAADGESGEQFGGAVSTDGEVAIIGAHLDDENGEQSGSAYIFRFDGESWVQEAKLLASDGHPYHHFATTVSVCGDVAVVGAGYNQCAYVFRFDGTQWLEEAQLKPKPGADNAFGNSVSIDGDYIVVGAVMDDDNGISSGAAYVYRFAGESWVQEAKLLASDGMLNERFGKSVSIRGNAILIGAHMDGYGSAYVYRFDSGNWMEEAKLQTPDGSPHYFGSSVSIDGDLAVVGAWADHYNGLWRGSAFVFRYDGQSWMESARLLAFDGEENDQFGRSVSISGGVVIAGMRHDDDNGEDAGAAYIFEGTALDCNGNDIPDECDIESGDSLDLNSNGIPDECECPADLDDDGDVDHFDLQFLLGAWGSPDGDVDGDGDTDTADLLALLAAWGECP